MRAFVLTRYGGLDAFELRDVPKPSPGPKEVLIQVHAAGLNPIDYKMSEGGMRVIYRYQLPTVAGNELSGVVAATGAGVTSLAESDRVFARVDKRRLGAFAEFAVVRESLVAKMPTSIDFTTAAAVPLAGLTALQALRDELRVRAGQKIFVSGGSGGVGTFAIQLGKWLGAHIATTASARGADMVRKLGADVVVDYTREPFEHVNPAGTRTRWLPRAGFEPAKVGGGLTTPVNLACRTILSCARQACDFRTECLTGRPSCVSVKPGSYRWMPREIRCAHDAHTNTGPFAWFSRNL